MDLLVEKLDGSRYYLSQYKVLITGFEESAPSVTRNSKQLDQRNGNIDFGGWHTDKTINITGYYRADDIDEEELIREKLYALLSDPNGYYITQLKATPNAAMERPGETSGSYYDKLKDYPSHKRFLVYTEAAELELVGNVNGTLLYKLTAEFKTIKLPYGESMPRDLDVKPNVPYYGRNYYQQNTPAQIVALPNATYKPRFTRPNADCPNGFMLTGAQDGTGTVRFNNVITGNGWWTVSFWMRGNQGLKLSLTLDACDLSIQTMTLPADNAWHKYVYTVNITNYSASYNFVDFSGMGWAFFLIKDFKVEQGNAPTPWSPAPEEPDYNKWYLDTYYNTNNLAIPYAGTVPCNQLEQGFTIEMTAKEASSSLSFKIDDTELTYSGAVASGDVFMFSGFSYTQNGLSIVSKTNKAYFVLQPDKPNRITCNVHGTVKINGFQNLYA